MKILSDINKHINDLNIEFYEPDHIYTILNDKHKKYLSVTTFIHSLYVTFDSDAIITKMMNGKNWNNKNKYWNMTHSEIKELWKMTGLDASIMGTKLHNDIECFMNQPIKYNNSSKQITHSDLLTNYNIDNNESIEESYYYDNNNCKRSKRIKEKEIIISKLYENNKIDNNSIEWNMFIKFVGYFPDLVPYRTEWVIYDKSLQFAGSIDMVYKNNDGTVDIYDWKRCKEIIKIPQYNKYSILPCIDYIPDTNFWKYTLQLNIYKRILEQNYGCTVKNLNLVIMHPLNKTNDFIIMKVNIMDDLIDDLFEYRKTQII
jgi:hypothetical protein